MILLTTILNETLLQIIHRDLALRNMLLTEEQIVKISDFGLAVNKDLYEVKTRKTLASRWLPPESIVIGNKAPVFTIQSNVYVVLSTTIECILLYILKPNARAYLLI